MSPDQKQESDQLDQPAGVRSVWLVTRRTRHATHHIVTDNITRIWLFVTLATALSFGLAVLDFMPWKLGTRWSIADVGRIAVSMVGLLALVINVWLPRKKVFAGIATAVAFTAIVIGSVRITTSERPPR